MTRAALRFLAEAPYDAPPPLLAKDLYARLCELAATGDPYASVKAHSNELIQALLPKLAERVKASCDPFRSWVKLALAGNVIDFGADSTFDLQETIERWMNQDPEVDDIDLLRERLRVPARVLYLADNAGELALDGAFIEHELAGHTVTLAVRGGPIINDATEADARQLGIERIARILSPREAVPGIDLSSAGDELRRAWAEADLVVSKGQGNFETLEEHADDRVFFLFMVKCPVVARWTGRALGAGVAGFRGSVRGD